MSIQRPEKLFCRKWAENGERFDIVEAGADHQNGRADIETGFPKQTMMSVLQGGVPPWGRDHNGILYQVTEAIQWMQAGGLPSFNQDFCNKNGGYSRGTIVQGDDPNRPWVLWQSLVDNNGFNPNQNKINVSTPQNGWVRYPVVSEVNGNTLYYDNDGGLLVASPSVQTEFYVSSSEGNDETGDGTKEKPYFSIWKALSVSPSSGSIVIYLKAQDTHYLTPDGHPSGNDNNVSQEFSVQQRSIIFQSYNDPVLDEAIPFFYQYGGDSSNAFCVESITRPKIILSWCYVLFPNGETQLYYYSLAGYNSNFYINFNGIEFEVDRLEEMNNSTFFTRNGFIRGDGTFSFVGCIFNEIPNFNNAYHYLTEGGNFILRYRNQFKNFDKSSKNAFLYWMIKITITIDFDIDRQQYEDSNYFLIESNTFAFLKRKAAYCDLIRIINNPSPSYQGLTTNFEINMDS